jgi:F420-dependent oxidoreductase-like protein
MHLAANLVTADAGGLAAMAENLGYDLALAAEGRAGDAVSVLGAAIASTTRIGLASGVMQLPGRPPGMAALTAATLDTLSGGRFRLGLGVSNPHVSVGWYGVAFDRPLGRTREYVRIVRAALAGEPVRHSGPHFPEPPNGPPGIPLVLPGPPRPDLPVYLGAAGPRSLRLAGEIADGWLSGFTTPDLIAKAVVELTAAREGAGRTMDGFEVIPIVPVSVADDVAAAAEPLRKRYAQLLAVGGDGENFYRALARNLGFDREMDEFTDRIGRGDLAGAAATVPLEFVEGTALLGPLDRIAGRMRAFAEAGVTTLSVMLSAQDTDTAGRIRILTEAAESRRRAELHEPLGATR